MSQQIAREILIFSKPNYNTVFSYAVIKTVTTQEMSITVESRDTNLELGRFSRSRNHGFSIYDSLIADSNGSATHCP